MDLGLAGMKALVTGGTKGIGRAVAEHFAAEGCDVAICARNAEEVAQTVAALSQRGVKATGRTVDVADGLALTQWVGDVATELGGIDIVVSNVSALAIGQGYRICNTTTAASPAAAIFGIHQDSPKWA